MLDHINDVYWLFIPFLMVIFGMVSGTHCLAMCGPLIYLTSKTHRERLYFQISRLFGYLVVMLVFFYFKNYFLGNVFPTQKKISILFPLFLICWGFLFIFKKKLTYFFERFNPVNHIFLLKFKSSFLKPFLLGLGTVLLPCGVLYTVFFSLLVFESLPLATFSILGFWSGTLMTMKIADVLKNLFNLQLLGKYKLILPLLIIALGAYGSIKRWDLNIAPQRKSVENSCH